MHKNTYFSNKGNDSFLKQNNIYNNNNVSQSKLIVFVQAILVLSNGMHPKVKESQILSFIIFF